MTTTEQLHRAEQAKELLGNTLFAEAMTAVRMNALVALASVDPTDTAAIMKLQAIAHCTEEVFGLLDSEITRSGVRDGGVSFTPKVVENEM